MTAEGLTVSLGGRWNGHAGLARCPAHDDRHPSFSIADKGGRIVFICRSGCEQRNVIAALTERGLWSASSHARPLPAAFRWEDHLKPNRPPVPPCCLQGPDDEL